MSPAGAVSDAEIRDALASCPTKKEASRQVGLPWTTFRHRLVKIEKEAADGLSHDVDAIQELPVIVRDYSHLDSLRVYPLGDVHKGSPRHEGARWLEWVGYIAGHPQSSMLGTGDFLNAALKDSKSESYDEVLTVGKAKRELRRELEPLAGDGRLDGMCRGNHEDRIYRAVGDCPIEDICDTLSVPYFPAAAVFVYIVGDVEYEMYVRHGTGNGQSLAGLPKGAMVVPTADVYVTGHTHRIAVTADEYFRRGDGVMRRERRYYVSSGSFLAYEEYAAQRGYTPTRIGAPRIHLDGRKRDVHVSV